MERLVLARGQPALEVFRVGQRAGKGGVRRRGRRIHEAARAHVDELALQVAHDPVRGKRRHVPRQPERQTRRHEAEQPARVELGARKAIDVPRAAETADVKELAGVLPPEDVRLLPLGNAGVNAHVGEGRAQALRLPRRDHERGPDVVRGPRSPDRARKSEVGPAHLLEPGRHDLRLSVDVPVGTRLNVDDDLQRTVKTVEKPPESCQPLVALVLGGARKSDRVGLDHGDRRRAILPALRGFGSFDADHGRVLHRTRRVARTNKVRSVSHRSRGRPRHLPHAAIAPTAASAAAAAPRIGATGQWADQTANAASRAITR